MSDESVFSDLARRLRRTDLLLLRAVRRQRARPAMRAKGQFWGSVITDDEVDELLRAHGEIDYPAGADGLEDAIAASTAYRDAPGGKLGHLRDTFGLDGDDIDLVLLSLAPEISAGYARIFAYLNDNLNQAYLTVDLATRVLRAERRPRLVLQSRLLPGSPLIRKRLVLMHPVDSVETHTSRRLHPAPRLLRWILARDATLFNDGVRPIPVEGEPLIPATTRERVEQLGGALSQPLTVAVVGGTTGMREGVAMAIARQAGRPLVRVDLDRCADYLEQPWDLVRDLQLADAIPFMINAPDVSEEPALRAKMMALGTAIGDLPYPVLVGGDDRRAVGAMLGGDRANVTVNVGRTTLDERILAWSQALERRNWDMGMAREIAERFYSVGGTTIDRVLERAQAETGGAEPDVESIWAACREAARPEFSGLAQRIIPKYNWPDLILPDKIIGQLRHLEQYLAQQETVMHRWGGQKVRPRGYGIKALFSGAPGTGKTMCAEVIAGSLGLDLFKIDLSAVISKWVGETEKHLKELFDSAEGGSSVLLFDEGDALFGSRGEAKSAQDKFANQEVAYLLQRLEVFEGCAIVTTNLQENIDEAFLRRFGTVVEFPFPGPAERTLLWRRAIPSAAPIDPDLDFEYLGRQFQLAGGAIINAAINACVIAAGKGERVSMRHAIVAVARELYKMGKQINRVHFGEFYGEVMDLF
jgi:hypothetical protein